MDDFGSGYSSLNMLNQMPLDILKLDMKFIQSETAKPVNQGILRFIMGLARSMNLSVVAEGVETREQLEHLREIGCDYVQGYYFAKPMPCGDFEALTKKEYPVAELEEREDMSSLLKHREQVLLVVDEDAQYRNEVKKSFQGRYHVVEAANSQAAFACIQSYEHKFAAVILSLTLQKQSGFLVLEMLQREKEIWNIPVIATGPSNKLLEERALSLGADDFAAKPHMQESLLKRIQRAMGITIAWQRERILRDEAYRDYLTGLFNRRGLYYAIESLRHEDSPLALYLFELDNLKQINDTFGHLEGDKLIVQVAGLLKTHTRRTDILAHFGGDEFVIIMKQMKSEENALKKGEDICKAIRESSLTEKFPAVSFAGIVVWNAEEPMETIIKRADEALRRAKTGNQGECYLWRG